MGAPNNFLHPLGPHRAVDKRLKHEARKDKKYKVHSLKKTKRDRERKSREELNDTNRG